MHPLFAKQLADATTASGEVNLAALGKLVAAAYETAELVASGVAVPPAMDGIAAPRILRPDAFRERLDHALRSLSRDQRLAVIVLEIPHDAPGGDALAGAAAERLRGCIREGDTMAALGNGRFAFILTQLAKPLQADAFTQKLCGAFHAPLVVADESVEVRLNAGIALAPADGNTAEMLIANARKALGEARKDGTGGYRFFAPALDAQMKARRALVNSLRHAIEAHEITLAYEPVANIAAGTISSCRARLDWNDPQHGRIAPSEFLPLAEECGLVVPLGEWALRQACEDAAHWPEDVTLTIRLLPVQAISANFPAIVLNALAVSGLPPRRLELEISEAALMAGADAPLVALRSLSSLGIQVALGEFGKTHSALNHLRTFAFTTVKIDRALAGGLPDDDEAAATIGAIAGLARSLGIAVAAEGIETQEQMDAARSLGCETIQGRLIGEPQPASDIAWSLAALAADQLHGN